MNKTLISDGYYNYKMLYLLTNYLIKIIKERNFYGYR